MSTTAPILTSPRPTPWRRRRPTVTGLAPGPAAERCGARQPVRTGGISGRAVMRLVVLDGSVRREDGTGDPLKGEEANYCRAGEAGGGGRKGVDEPMEVWREPTANARSWANLPAQAIKY